MGRVGHQRHAAAAGEVADVEGIVVDEQDAAQDGRVVAVEPFPSEDAFEVVVLAVVAVAGDDIARRVFRCDEVLLSGAEDRVDIALAQGVAGSIKRKLVFCLPGDLNTIEIAMGKLVLPELEYLLNQLTPRA